MVDKRPSFFTLILADHSPITRRLLIPPNFMEYISEELTQSAILRVDLGRHWHIKLHQTEKGVYLQNGWKEFLNDNSLGDNEFLHFTYDGNMCFDVKIYDMSGCEKVYASVTNEGSAIPNEKRKRGRPRKIVKQSAPISGKRPRGRPRKIEQCPPIIEKRKLGRPRKNFAGTPCIHQIQSFQNSPGIRDDIKAEEIGLPILAPDNQPPPPPLGSSERPLELNSLHKH